jgi:type II secretory pathway component GspD/PulD (secretin)
MTYSRGLRASLFAASMICFANMAPAQDQPPQAVNQQDEVVTIDLDRVQGADDVARILRSDDKRQTNRYITQAIELHNTLAVELLLTLSTAVALENGIVRGAVTYPSKESGEKARQFIVFTTTREQMPSLLEAVRVLDVPNIVNAQGSSRKALRVKYRRASDLGAVLKGTRLTSQAKVFADDLTNTLYFDDSPYVMEKTEEYLAFFDVPVPQIEFDVQIIDIREDGARRLGLDWDAWKRTVGGQISVSGNRFEGGGGTFARLDGLLALDANVLAQFLNYTVQSGSARLVQRSRLTASNLKPAVISDRRRVPFQEYVRTSQTGAILTEPNVRVDANGEQDPGEPDVAGPRIVAITPPVVNRLTELGAGEEGIVISIQPVIGTEAVTADVKVAVNTVTGHDQLGKPIVALQELTNQFTLVNDQQLLLGTLEREMTVTGRSGIPGLKDIPVIKYLFSVETDRKQKSRLFIVANPTFRHVGYDAATIGDARNAPVIEVGTTGVVLEDNGLMEPPVSSTDQ